MDVAADSAADAVAGNVVDAVADHVVGIRVACDVAVYVVVDVLFMPSSFFCSSHMLEMHFCEHTYRHFGFFGDLIIARNWPLLPPLILHPLISAQAHRRPHILTWMEDFRSAKLALIANFCLDSEFLVKQCSNSASRIPKNTKNEPLNIMIQTSRFCI